MSPSPEPCKLSTRACVLPLVMAVHPVLQYRQGQGVTDTAGVWYVMLEELEDIDGLNNVREWEITLKD